MAVFVDTLGVLAVLNPRDENHRLAAGCWPELVEDDESLVTTNYVLIETSAVLAWRLGFEAVRSFQTDVVPVLEIAWIDQSLHELAVASMITAGERDLSLVDCVSFALMRQQGLESAFAFDDHFIEQGFRRIP